MKKIIFLDRDGVINKDPGGWTKHSYVTRVEDFIFLPGSIEAAKKLTDAGYDIIIISNQAGISKGHYTEARLTEINDKMVKELEKNGVKLKAVYYCIHQNSDNCDCRKPKTGLFERAEKELGFKAKDTFFIGDGKMDVRAAQKFGLKSILVLSGKTNSLDVKTWDIKPDFIFNDLLHAVNFLLNNKS